MFWSFVILFPCFSLVFFSIFFCIFFSFVFLCVCLTFIIFSPLFLRHFLRLFSPPPPQNQLYGQYGANKGLGGLQHPHNLMFLPLLEGLRGTTHTAPPAPPTAPVLPPISPPHEATFTKIPPVSVAASVSCRYFSFADL